MLARVLHLAELTVTHSLKHMLPIMHVNNEENKVIQIIQGYYGIYGLQPATSTGGVSGN